MTVLSQDLPYAVRILLKSPGFAAISILTLALGIGANTALFSIVNGVLLNPLPYPHSEQLVAVSEKRPEDEKSPPVYLNFLDWQRQTRTFASMAIYRNKDYNLSGGAEAQRLTGYMISANFFSTLGVIPILGREFRPEDDQVGAGPVVILGAGFWTRAFGASPDVAGKSLILNGTSYTIVGVIPSSFRFYGQDRDVYTPIGQWNDASFRDRRISVSARVVGRLKPRVSLQQAKADMDVISRNLAVAFPDSNKTVGVTLVPMKEGVVGNVKPLLLVLLGAVGFLLLITCANVANLLLARATRRAREFAVRSALGASHARIVRQLLTENLLLSILAGALGLLIAFGAVRAAVNGLPGTLPRAAEISLDGRVLFFAVAQSLFAVIVFGFSPALKSSRVDLSSVLREGGRGSSGARHRLQGAFVAVQVAMTLVLLVGAGLMLRSLAALWRVNPGYQPSGAITFSVSIPSTSATTSADTRARLRQLHDKILSIPGVRAVSVTLGSRPMIHDSAVPFWIEGRPKPVSENEMPGAMFYLVESDFLRAMGMTLERGRFVTPQDNENTPLVITIDDVFERSYFRGENPVGKHVHLAQFDVEAEIVGVVGHIKQWGPGGEAKASIDAQFFYPFMQLPEKLMTLAAGGVAVVVRTEGDPARIMNLVRRSVQEVDSREVVYGAQTLDQVLAGALAPRRLAMILLGVFAGLALVLACVGIYGVVSYFVGERTHEIGVRIALGAQRSDVIRLVLWEGAKMASIGVAAGGVTALGLTRLMANQLFGVSAHDPLTFGAVALLLLLVALFACYLPAHRAMRIDPVVALRHE